MSSSMVCLGETLGPGSTRLVGHQEQTDLVLGLWEDRGKERRYGFGMGPRFLRLRYPHVWFDAVHALEALSPFPWVWSDRRFLSLVDAVRAQAGPDLLYVPGSIYLEWSGWCFGQKREPSAWLTLVIRRALLRGDLGPEFRERA